MGPSFVAFTNENLPEEVLYANPEYLQREKQAERRRQDNLEDVASRPWVQVGVGIACENQRYYKRDDQKRSYFVYQFHDIGYGICQNQ